MSADVAPYWEALNGYKETVHHTIVAEYDMKGDFGNGKQILSEIESEVKPDLILAMGVWALQVVVRQKPEIPVVFAMVLNPPSILGGEARNVTGASMNIPVDQPIRILEQLGPEIRRVGVLFNPSLTGYMVKAAEAVARQSGMTLLTRPVASSREAIRAMDALQKDGMDALWILPDETVLDPKVFEYALLTSYRNKIPLLGLSERQAEMGAVLSIAFASSTDIGRQAGELTNAILGGKSTGRIPYTVARSTKLIVNLKAAEKLGLRIPQSILAMADSVIR